MKRLSLWILAFLVALPCSAQRSIPGDINQDGTVDKLDLFLLGTYWHFSEQPTPTPFPISDEPSGGIIITGTVMPLIDGSPIAGALITLGDARTQAETDGTYSLTLPGPGTYVVHVEAPGYCAFDSVQQLLNSQEFTIRLRPQSGFPPPSPACSVYGIVYDALTFDPIVGAVASVGGVSTVTDANGFYRINNVLAGLQTVTVTAQGYEQLTRDVQVALSVEVNAPLSRSRPTITMKIDLPGLPTGAKPLEMVLIPAGTFLMGSPESDRSRNPPEMPQHPVTITKPFYLGKCEVTQAQWEAVMGSNPAGEYGAGDNYPVYNVSWSDCQEFIGLLNAMDVGVFRLPTEAEWEYACRAGTTTPFFWEDLCIVEETHLGNVSIVKNEWGEFCILEDDGYAWFSRNSEEQAHEVGLKLPNGFGLYDMNGNVYEWCFDWYAPYGDDAEQDPTGPAFGTDRVRRGAFWNNDYNQCRAAYRGLGEPTERNYNTGFRLLREYP